MPDFQEMTLATHGTEVSVSAGAVHGAGVDWRLAFSDGAKRRQVSVPAADLTKLSQAVAKAKERFGMPASSGC